MKKYIVFLLFSFAFLTIFAQKGQEREYEIEMAEVGQPGSLVVKVWCYARKPNISDVVYKTCALKGVLFRGIDNNGRIQGRTALVMDGYDAHSEYFNKFFMNDYQNYVRIAQNGYVDQDGIVKIKKQYKVAKLVVVSYNELRSRLEEDNIIKSLNSGF